MPVKTIRPTTNGQRQMTVIKTAHLDDTKRDKNLTVSKNRLSGRSHGKIVVAHRGGGAKRLYRLVDFKRTDYLGEVATVETLEYDPNRTAFIAKIIFNSNEKYYIIAPEGLKVGDKVVCGEEAPIKAGNRMKLANIALGSQIHDIEVSTGKGGQLARSAGSYATLLGFDDKYAIIRLPSGESRKILAHNFASIGIVSNADHSNVTIGKAGRTRLMGRRPIVRGKAKNPVDHPHGGGEGNTSIGLKYPKTPWGAPALGRRTRNKKKINSSLILNRRKR